MERANKINANANWELGQRKEVIDVRYHLHLDDGSFGFLYCFADFRTKAEAEGAGGAVCALFADFNDSLGPSIAALIFLSKHKDTALSKKRKQLGIPEVYIYSVAARAGFYQLAVGRRPTRRARAALQQAPVLFLLWFCATVKMPAPKQFGAIRHAILSIVSDNAWQLSGELVFAQLLGLRSLFKRPGISARLVNHGWHNQRHGPKPISAMFQSAGFILAPRAGRA